MKRILLVDDELELIESFVGILSRRLPEGGVVDLAVSGRQAFDMFKKNPYDVVVSDVRMPDGNGVMLLEQIVASFEKMPLFLFLTGYSDYPPKQLLGMGAAAVLEKPISLTQLWNKILENWQLHTSNIH